MDWEVGQDNPCEDQHRKLTHHSNRGSSDPTLKPNLEEKQDLERIVSMPAYGEPMTPEDKDLLFKYRYTIFFVFVLRTSNNVHMIFTNPLPSVDFT